MAFTKFIYNLIGWKNKSDSLTTPLGATNLNKMDSAIKTIGDNLNAAYDEMSTGKLDMSTAYTMVKDVTYDDGTGIFTITKLDGTTVTIDTKLEKIVTNWGYDKDFQKLILTLDDGTTQEVDLSALITQYEFVDSDTISFTIGSNGTVTANLKDGSITEEKLQPNYLAEVKNNASNAETSAQNSSEYADNASYDAKLAQSYAIGGSGIREGEDADNAKYYMEQAKDYSQGSASNISYDNTASGAEATNVQDALDEIQKEYLRQDALMDSLADNANEAQYNMLKDMNEVETDVEDYSLFAGISIETNKTKSTLYKRSAVTVWNYIKSKIESVLGIKGVANNLVTNQEGYALDARQGTTLLEKIENINSILGLQLIYSKASQYSTSKTITANMEHFLNEEVKPAGVYLIVGTKWSTTPQSGIYLVQYSGNLTTTLTTTTILDGGGITISLDADNQTFTVTGKVFRIYALQ